MNFVKFLGRLFCRTSSSNHVSHDIVFFLLGDQLGLQLKINLFDGAVANLEQEFASPFDPVKLLRSGGNFIV